jgi:hypothetical protein
MFNCSQKLITHKKQKDKYEVGPFGGLLPPSSDILGAALIPIGQSGYHVLGGLPFLGVARGLFLLLRGLLGFLLLLLLPHEVGGPFHQGFAILDFLVKLFF